MTTGASAGADAWIRLEPRFDGGVGEAAALGLVVLSSDRVCARDVEAFLPDGDAVALFSARVPLDIPETPASLRALAGRLEGTAALLVPGAPLDAVAFGCTAASAAIGGEAIRRAIQAVRPGVPVTDPMDAAIAGLAALGCRRVALLVPTYDELADEIVAGLEAHGIRAVARGTFDVDGDPRLNRIAAGCLVDAGASLGAHPDAEAVFLSCTGMRTRHVVERLERRLGKPVVTSNQALAWRLLRLSGQPATPPERGRLLRLPAPS